MIVQFFPTYPVVMAQFSACFGIPGLFLVNAVLAGLNLVLFYQLCRLFVPHRFAILATTAMGLSLSQVAMSRLTLSEMMVHDLHSERSALPNP